MAKRARSEMVATPEFRAFFAGNLFRPNKNGRYTLLMGIPKASDITALWNMVVQVAQEQWPDNYQAILQAANPIKDGDTVTYTRGERVGQLKKNYYPEFVGMWILDAGSSNKPGVVDQNVQAIMSEEDFYSGCWAHAKVNAFAYSNDSTGVALGLGCVQKIRDDDRLGGGAMDASQEFAPIPGAAAPVVPGVAAPPMAPTAPVSPGVSPVAPAVPGVPAVAPAPVPPAAPSVPGVPAVAPAPVPPAAPAVPGPVTGTAPAGDMFAPPGMPQ